MRVRVQAEFTAQNAAKKQEANAKLKLKRQEAALGKEQVCCVLAA